jgi:hypothetical protein
VHGIAKRQRDLFELYKGKMMAVCLRYACDLTETVIYPGRTRDPKIQPSLVCNRWTGICKGNYEVPILIGYRSKFGRASYGAVLGVDYAYFLSRHFALFTQPYSRYSISNYRMFVPAQRLSFGTLLGIRYQL